jgi:cell division protein YceG involved in septum cleavage
MKPYIVALLGNDKKEYAFGDKKLSKEDTVKELLKLFKAASEVNFVETTEEGDESSKQNSEKQIIEEANKYAKENKVSFSAALKSLLAKKKGN